jgi:hypothetical protein
MFVSTCLSGQFHHFHCVVDHLPFDSAPTGLSNFLKDLFGIPAILPVELYDVAGELERRHVCTSSPCA